MDKPISEPWVVTPSARDTGAGRVIDGFSILGRDNHIVWLDQFQTAALLSDALAALEPFAQMAIEGVITKAEGHVGVTTCAEYFHRARFAFVKLAGRYPTPGGHDYGCVEHPPGARSECSCAAAAGLARVRP